MAVSSAANFTIENNVLFGNTSFLGAVGPNCTVGGDAVVPTPAAFVIDTNNTQQMTMQFDFEDIPDGDGLTCVLPPADGDFWPFGGNPGSPSSTSSPSPTSSGSPGSPGKGETAGEKAAIALGVILALVLLGAGLSRLWYVRKRKLATPSRTMPLGVKW